jgi:hypothetical protein
MEGLMRAGIKRKSTMIASLRRRRPRPNHNPAHNRNRGPVDWDSEARLGQRPAGCSDLVKNI